MAQPPTTPLKPKCDFLSSGCSLPRAVTSAHGKAPVPPDHGRTLPVGVPSPPWGFHRAVLTEMEGDEGQAGARLSLPSARRVPGWRGACEGCSMCCPPPAHLRAAAGAGEGGRPRAGEPDASQRLEGNRRGGRSSFPTSVLPPVPRERQSLSLKVGSGGFCPPKEGDSEGWGLRPGLPDWPRVIFIDIYNLGWLFITWITSASSSSRSLGGQTRGAWVLQEPPQRLRAAGTPGSPSHTPGWSQI